MRRAYTYLFLGSALFLGLLVLVTAGVRLATFAVAPLPDDWEGTTGEDLSRILDEVAREQRIQEENRRYVPDPARVAQPRFLVYTDAQFDSERLDDLAAEYCKARGAKYLNARTFLSPHLGDLPRELGMRDFREVPPLEPTSTTDIEADKIYFLFECEWLPK